MIDTKSLLQIEQKISPLTLGLMLSCLLTGIASYITDSHGVWLQWSILLHLLTGLALGIIIIVYLYVHFRRTVGFRRTSVMISGLVTILLCGGFLTTGLQLSINGQSESTAWVYLVHIICGFTFVGIIVLHLVLHIKLMPRQRRLQESRFPSLVADTVKQIIIFNLLVQGLIATATVAYSLTLTPYSTQPAVVDYQYSYGEHRFRPSQTETSNNAFVEQQQIANSHRCASCHEDITKQWISSAHQQAASDQAYVTNITLLADKKGISATRYCEGCHAPVALLTGELSPGGEHGGITGTVGNMEGISCLGCHGIDSLPHLKGVASYQFSPVEDYLFTRSENKLLLSVHDLLVRIHPAQHKKDMGKALFKDPKFCSSCHTQFMDKDMNNWGWIKMQDEYAAWLNSPYSKQHEENFSSPATVRCQDCHMPLVDSTDPSADGSGKVRAHHFPGANTFLPILRGDTQQLNATKRFLQSDKLRISIDKPKRTDAQQTASALDESLRNFEESPYFYYLGETANIQLVVSNHGVGHDFPGGTIDINEAWIEFLVLDIEGRSVFSSGELASDNSVDENAYFYRSLAVDRRGELVWQHDLFNMVGESFRRVIKAGESDIVNYQFRIPSWAKSPLTVTSTLKYRKLNERYARWALKDRYIEIPVVDMAWDSLIVPIKVRKEVEAIQP